jgi:hypothetical protein
LGGEAQLEATLVACRSLKMALLQAPHRAVLVQLVHARVN